MVSSRNVDYTLGMHHPRTSTTVDVHTCCLGGGWRLVKWQGHNRDGGAGRKTVGLSASALAVLATSIEIDTHIGSQNPLLPAYKIKATLLESLLQ